MTVPFAVNITGDPIFPHNGNTSTDVTISTPTTWAHADYPGRIVTLDRLDVDDVLTLSGSPWFIFVSTLDMGASGEIRCDGPDGDTGGAAASIYTRGGFASSTGIAAGGCGGGMVFICAETVTGTASRPISADGGDGARNTTNASADVGMGGEGAFGRISTQTATSYSREALEFYNLLGDGSGSSVGGYGGGSGGVSTSGTMAGGGSGIGGGAAAGSAGATTSGSAARNIPSVVQLVELAIKGCRGGGGGGAVASTTGTNNAAGGGGGGAVVLWYRTSSAAPTLSASGGASVGTSSNPGADGITYSVQVP